MQIHRRRQIREEAIPMDARSCFAVRDFRLKNFEFRWHRHPAVELTLILRGRGLRFVLDTIEPFTEGDLCLLGSNTPHSWCSEPQNGSVRSLVAQFGANLWGRDFMELPEMRPIARLLILAQRGIHVHGKMRSRVRDMFIDLYKAPTGSAVRIAKLLEILAMLAGDKTQGECRLLGIATPDIRPAARHDQLLETIITRLQTGPANAPKQSQMAHNAGLSPAAFSRFFKRQMGKPYVQYLGDWRIAHVCRLLAETDQTVTAIAMDSGFANLSNFNRRFKIAKGVTPRQYRAMYNQTDG
ncbi:MAG: AraC family transcriptional regulator [Phycisphaerae bacterium]